MIKSFRIINVVIELKCTQFIYTKTVFSVTDVMKIYPTRKMSTNNTHIRISTSIGTGVDFFLKLAKSLNFANFQDFEQLISQCGWR